MATTACPRCSHPLEPDARFCSSCGELLTGNALNWASLPAPPPSRENKVLKWTAIAASPFVVVFLAIWALHAAAGNTTTGTDFPKAPTSTAPSWDSTNMDVGSNGNMSTAVATLQRNPSPSTVPSVGVGPLTYGMIAKAPFRYIGTIYRFQGIVAIVKDYPPGATFGGAVPPTTQFGEIVMTDVFQTSLVPMDVVMLGGSGTAQEGSAVLIDGYVAGTEMVTNRLGGQTEQVVIVGRYAPRTAR